MATMVSPINNVYLVHSLSLRHTIATTIIPSSSNSSSQCYQQLLIVIAILVWVEATKTNFAIATTLV